MHGTLTPKQLEHQDAIFRSAQRLTDLINDLLDVSRLEAGLVELQPRPDLHGAVDQVTAVISVAALASAAHHTNALPPHLPPVTCRPRARLQQILVNLIGNAVKFSSAWWIG